MEKIGLAWEAWEKGTCPPLLMSLAEPGSMSREQEQLWSPSLPPRAAGDSGSSGEGRGHAAVHRGE